MSKWNLRAISLVAYGIFGIGIVCNMTFYSGFGNGSSSLIYAMFGLLFDLAKVLSIVAFVYFVRDFEAYITETTICGIMWLVLSILSLAAAYGFFSEINEKYEAMRLKESAIYARYKQAVDNAQAKLDNLAQYANVDTAAITAQIASYQSANDALFNTIAKNSRGQNTGRTVSEITAQCTKNNWYTRHYCGKRVDNRAKIQQLQARLDGYERYQSSRPESKIYLGSLWSPRFILDIYMTTNPFIHVILSTKPNPKPNPLIHFILSTKPLY
jgi:hypothetical protein